jgi:hypothetical protein
MNRRIRGLLPYLLSAVFVLACMAASGNAVYADSVFQQQRYVELVATAPLDLGVRSFQTLPPVSIEATEASADAIQTFGKHSGSVQINRLVEDPNRIVVQPIREGPSGTVPVPEPATMVLLGTGLAGAAGFIRRRRNASKTN